MDKKKILAAAMAVIMVAGGAAMLPGDIFGGVGVASASPVGPGDDELLNEWVFTDLGNNKVEATAYKGDKTEVTIPSSYEGKQVTKVGFQCFTCSSSPSVEYRNENNKNIKVVIIPDGVEIIDALAFEECPNLEEVVIPSSVKQIGGGAQDGGAFFGCEKLTKIDLPEGLKTIELGTFGECSSLVNLRIPDSVTKIEDLAFDGCTSLKNINIPNGVESIGTGAFQDCKSLTELTLPDSLKIIGAGTFQNTGLTKLTIPRSVTTIAKNGIGFNVDAAGNASVNTAFTAYVYKNSAAHNFCETNGVNYVLLDPDDSSSAPDSSSSSAPDSSSSSGSDNTSSSAPDSSSSKPDDSKGDNDSKPSNEDETGDNKGEDDSKPSNDGDDDGKTDETDGYWALGDVNGDTVIDIEDVTTLINQINGLSALDDYERLRGDVDKNDNIDIEDAVAIVNHINGTNFIVETIKIPASFKG